MKEKSKFNSVEKMTIPMEPNQELKVIERAEKLGRELGFDRDSIDEIKLAVIEAVINAIEHGENPERMVYISFELSRQPLQMRIIISDSGTGFDPDSVREPNIKEKLKKHESKRGWGLKIMHSLMDEVRIDSSPSGTQVTLVKTG